MTHYLAAALLAVAASFVTTCALTLEPELPASASALAALRP
jgi:hypothetical protein